MPGISLVDDTVMLVILVGVTAVAGVVLDAEFDAAGCAIAGGDCGAATGPLPGGLRTSVAADATDATKGKANAVTSNFKG